MSTNLYDKIMSDLNIILSTICSVVLAFIALVYEEFGGLRIGIDQEGAIFYANALMSTGSDESFIIRCGLIIYILPILSNVFLIFKRSNSQISAYLSILASIWFWFCLIAVHLDVSVIDSIKYGDKLLFISILFSFVLFCSSSMKIGKKVVIQIWI